MNALQIEYVPRQHLDQNPERQLEGMPVARTFTDKAGCQAATIRNSHELRAYRRHRGLHSMDRLARNLDDLRRIGDRCPN